MALFWGRQYCNTLCPVGTLLGLLSRFSFFRIRLNSATCIACKRCERVCRGGCLDISVKTVDASRCVACFDCLAICPNASLTYRPVLAVSQETQPDPSRRKFLLGTASTAGAVVLTGLFLRPFAKPLLSWKVVPRSQRQPLQDNLVPIVPPGAKSIARFAAACTGCHLCVSVCPTHVLQPTGPEYGLQGVLQPTMDYRAGYCDYDCTRCGEVCPTHAIEPLPLDAKRRTQIGTVKLIEDRCIVYDRKEECGACVEVCPTHAVYGEEIGGLLHPHTKTEHCIGCGRCENVCPVNPAAIFVEGMSEHAWAEPPFYRDRPEADATDQKKSQEFPF
jgi:ferredoxin